MDNSCLLISEFNKTVPRECDYFIYAYSTGECPPEKILPGLNEGNKIRFATEYSGDLSIGEYEIIS